MCNVNSQDSGHQTLDEKPTPSDEHRQAAKDDMARYKEDRPTAVLPGSDGTVSGTAINEWLDDDGNPIEHSKDGEGRGVGGK